MRQKTSRPSRVSIWRLSTSTRVCTADPGRNRHAGIFSRQPAFGSPNDADARTRGVHQKATKGRPQHRCLLIQNTCQSYFQSNLTCQNHCAAVLVRIALATTGDVAQQKPIGSKPIPGRKAHGRSRISTARRKPTIFDEREELLASDVLTLASRHSLTAGESCDGSTVAYVRLGCDGVTPSAQ